MDKNVSLSRIPEAHLFFLHRWRNDPRIWKWCRQYKPISWDDHLRWFKNQNDDPTIEMFEICHGDSFVGVCGLTSIDLVNSRAEFSLYIGPEYWGNGFAEAGLKELCKWGFNYLGLNSIWGESFEGNPAMNLFLDLGFKREGVRREFYFRDGKFVDAHLFSLLRKECKFVS